MNPAIQHYAAVAGQIALFPFTYVVYYIFYTAWLAIDYSLVVPSRLGFQTIRDHVPVDWSAVDYKELAVVAARIGLRVVLFPFTNILFYVILSVWLVLKHTIVVPFLLMIRIAVFGLIYLPLTPVLTAADVDYDKTVTVEGLLLQLAVHSVPHVAFFAIHLLHYVIIAAVTGVIVGWFTGLNISVVSNVLTPPPLEEVLQEELERTKAKMEELKAQLPSIELPTDSKSEDKKEPAVKVEPVDAVSKIKEQQTEPEELLVADIVKNKPKSLKRGKVDFSETGAEHTYEDDDGYNYMRYLKEDIEPESRPATIKEEQEETDSNNGENSGGLSPELSLSKSQKKRRLRKRREASRRSALGLTPATIETAETAETPETAGFSDVEEESTEGTHNVDPEAKE